MKTYKFKAKIQQGDGGGAYVLIPHGLEKELNAKGRPPIKATFDGFPYVGSIFKYGLPQYMLLILKSIREKIGKQAGDIVDVEITKDEKQRTVEIPADFKKILKNKNLLKIFEKLSYTHQKEYCRWIAEAKKEETRLRRMEKTIEMLKR